MSLVASLPSDCPHIVTTTFCTEIEIANQKVAHINSTMLQNYHRLNGDIIMFMCNASWFTIPWYL